jgi:hypothetical protein
LTVLCVSFKILIVGKSAVMVETLKRDTEADAGRACNVTWCVTKHVRVTMLNDYITVLIVSTFLDLNAGKLSQSLLFFKG